MKTLETISMKNMVKLVFVTFLLTLASCQNKKKNNKEQKIPVIETTTNTKPPALDLHAATFMGDIEAVQQHIKAGTDLNKKDDYGSTPLITASLFGKTEVAIALVDGGAALNLTNNDGSTALHSAAFFCRPEIVKALLDHGADKTIKNIYGSTPLESISGPFEDVKGIYDQISQDLGPLGFKLDYTYLEETRPKIVAMLQ